MTKPKVHVNKSLTHVVNTIDLIELFIIKPNCIIKVVLIIQIV